MNASEGTGTKPSGRVGTSSAVSGGSSWKATPVRSKFLAARRPMMARASASSGVNMALMHTGSRPLP